MVDTIPLYMEELQLIDCACIEPPFQCQWREQTIASSLTSPCPRGGHSLTFIGAPSSLSSSSSSSPAASGLKNEGCVVLFGGSNRVADFYNDVNIFNVATQAWLQPLMSSKGVLPDPRSGHSAVYDAERNRILIYGGQKLEVDEAKGEMKLSLFNDLWSLEVTTESADDAAPTMTATWTRLQTGRPSISASGAPSSSSASEVGPKRNAHSAHIIENNMYVLFGADDKGPSYKVYVLDLTTLQWQLMDVTAESGISSELPEPREMHLSVVCGKRIIIGGGKGIGAMYRDMFVLDVETKQWKLLGLCPDRCAATSLVVHNSEREQDGWLLLVAGADASGFNADALVCDLTAAMVSAGGDDDSKDNKESEAIVATENGEDDDVKVAEEQKQNEGEARSKAIDSDGAVPGNSAVEPKKSQKKNAAKRKKKLQARLQKQLDGRRVRCPTCQGMRHWIKLLAPPDNEKVGGEPNTEVKGEKEMAQNVDTALPSRMAHAMVQLPDGRILVIGGINEEHDLNDVQLLTLVKE